ncbi:hypothetical protein TrVFT333_010785 [Trichoderma virens FT-333]|nr:hypothetical protein TrVFT333_010785 [Trichoderma virens FT-333]
MAAVDVDVGYIAGHLGLDQPVVATLTTQPTADLVATLLQAVATKAHEFETLYAEKLQTDIELENAVRNSETKSQTFKGTAEKALKDVEEARQRLKEEETKRQSLENELQSLKAKYSDHDAEVKALNDKIETLQSSNRTNLSIIESNNKRDQTLTEELTKQHQRNVELSREVTTLQQSEQNAKGQLNSAKYRQEALQQQLDLARQNAEWLETELKTKSDEALKYRKEKGSKIAELQRQNEDAKAQIDAFKRSEQQLRERLDAMQAKADDALVKLQKQEGSFAATVESYKQELDDQRRLVEMSEQLSKKHQDRVRELESEKERLKDNYENELRRVRLELESERRVTGEMEERIRRLESDLDEAQVRMEHAAPASSAIEQLYQVKGQLASEKRRNQQLAEELDGMIAALEAKTPEIQELQSEAETLRNEIAHMSELSQQSFEERDAARKAARKAESTLATAQSESKILRTQLRDLGTQIQMLVFNIYAIERGMDQLTEEEKYRLQQLEKGEITEEALSDMSDTHQFITQKLVVFKDIKSLQAKNEDLLRITRELAEQMESEEALAAKHQAKEDHDLVEKLQQDLTHMMEEIKSAKITMESYKMERDMFRRLLQQRGAGEEHSSLMRHSIAGQLPMGSIESVEQTETLTEALRKIQAEYDSFRDAQDGVRKDFRDQIDHLSSEKNALQTANIKLQGEARLEFERREMLQSNYVALQTENSELQKRTQILSETAAKQDIRTQQVAEELIEVKGLLDSMRNETANLKAEKKLWKDIQERMSKDNDSLIEEKNRLGNLLTAQQSLENERNITESEARRKAQTKIETLELELSTAQKKLSQAVEDAQHLQQRKEYEAKESQKRIDDLMASLSQLREEHVSIKTSRDHLQARVDELTVELRSAEERAGRLQPRPTPRPGLMTDTNVRQQELEAEIQDLNNDISDLKRDLDMANTQLENAKAQAEQYKELSQGNEEALEDLRASQDEYRQEMEILIQQKDARIKELGQQIEDLSAELSRSNTELSTIRDSQGEVARKYEDEKTILEEEIKRLKEESSRHIEAARYHQQDLRAQAEIASKAQQDYEKELVKHAEAAKLVQELRNEYNEYKRESASLRAEAESAKVTLAQSESSWEDRRQQLEQEMAELKQRREDANAQNKLLHQQLESLTSQISAMQQKRSDIADADEAMSPVGVGDAIEGMRELNGYLRREKEILEVQYDMKTNESKRLQQQVEYLQSQLDETRLKLDQERQASQSGNTSMAHKDLMEKLHELNLYRESSMALRTENNQLKDQITEKNKKIDEMTQKIQPLETEIDNLSTQKSFLEEEIKQIQEDRDRWQKRTEGILTKYGRVDPAEMEQLKQTITDLEKERDALKEGEQPLQTKVAELESVLETERANWSNTRAKLTEQFKERSRKITGEKNEASQRANSLQEQLDKVNGTLAATKKQAEQFNEERAELLKQIHSFQQQVEELRRQAQQTQPLAAQPPAQQPQSDTSASSEVVAVLEQRLTDARKELEAVNAQKLGAEHQLERLRSELQTAASERDSALLKLQEATAAAPSSTDAVSTTVPETGEGQPAANGLPDAERKVLEGKVAAAEAKAAEFEQKANEVEAKIQQTIKERSDRMKDTLNNKLKESRAKLEEEFKRKDDDLKLRFEQEKLIWQAENPSKAAPAKETPAAEQQPPSTPAKAEAPSVSATPAAGGPPDLSQLDDSSIRQFLASNTTVKNIIAANIRKKMDTESAKIKAEYEGKITAAREQAQLMESKKSTLRINMAENKLRTATAKLGVVETAANETPQKPVVEVWEVAKSTQAPAPAQAAAKAPAPASAANTPVRQPSISGSMPISTAGPPAGAPAAAQAARPALAPLVATTPSQAATQPPPEPKAADSTVPATGGNQPPQASNPFAVPAATAGASGSGIPNPFAKPETANAPAAQPAQPQQQAQQASQLPQPPQLPQIPPQPQQQGQMPVRSGIPMPRGGGRGRGGAYVPPSQRAAGGNEAGQAHAGRGGRGGARGGRGGMNAAATEFQPGAKRPRGDSEAASAGAKRARELTKLNEGMATTIDTTESIPDGASVQKRKLPSVAAPAAKRSKNSARGAVAKTNPKAGGKAKAKPARQLIDAASLAWQSVGEEFGGLEVIEGVDVVRNGGTVQFLVAEQQQQQQKPDSSDSKHKQGSSKGEEQAKEQATEAQDAVSEPAQGPGDGPVEGEDVHPGQAGDSQGGVESKRSQKKAARKDRAKEQKKEADNKHKSRDAKLATAEKELQKPASHKQQGNSFDALMAVDDAAAEEADMGAWVELSLSTRTVSAIAKLGFSKPTLIQQKTIPEILAGDDVIGKAQTGSGKTLAFGIPIVEKWLELYVDKTNVKREGPTAVVLSPTRELAKQISDHIKALCDGLPTAPYVCTVTGGLSIHKQQRQLEKADIVIATPGRLWEVLDGDMSLQDSFTKTKFLVVDEADRLFKAGQFKEAEDIIGALDRRDPEADDEDDDELPRDRRSGKGSKAAAGSDEEKMEYLMKCLKFRGQPKFIDVNPVSQMADGLKEGLIECGAMEKDLYLYTVLVLNPGRRTLVFTNSISAVRRLTPLLQNLGLSALPLHSQMIQKARLRSIERFAAASNSILVATDVAARGLDIKEVDQVLHYHVPRQADTYIHRSGRTARGDRSGVSVILCSPEEVLPTRRLASKVHAEREGGSGVKREHFIETLSIDRKIAAHLKSRVDLAKRIADAVLAKEKGHSEDTWLRNAAEELGVDYDSEEFDGSAPGNWGGRGGGRKKKEKEARQLSKAEMGALRAQLREELSKRVNLGVSEKYITGGRVDIGALLREREKGSVGGLFLGGDGLMGLNI